MLSSLPTIAITLADTAIYKLSDLLDTAGADYSKANRFDLQNRTGSSIYFAIKTGSSAPSAVAMHILEDKNIVPIHAYADRIWVGGVASVIVVTPVKGGYSG